MKSDLMMDFSVDRANHSITVKREFAAELPLVWDAYTNSDMLDQWWAPKPWQARTKSMNFSEGGHWHYAMVGPQGEEHWGKMSYLTIEPQRRFTAQDAFTDASGTVNPQMPVSTMDITFVQKDGKTLVTNRVTYADLAQLEASLKMGMKEGLTMAMEGLDELLATKTK
ncbi:SRPBCC domain-containing protein [Fibrella sp. HMF5335]|uniref:SRPBCC domain-containing protein n=1 Tax=Fibrella rubiginis TaxID=2817060 RepID=A0A939GJ92_9BACT|nr:SRPBCC domain-containing protein [Fibrella rubiginis]MBO0937458.1 SRPBCC domain-containing protein [Fibrella rubiginis]